MVPSRIVFVFLPLLFLSTTVAETKQPDMFLCLDSMMLLKHQTGSEPQKLVYGYINGKKTPCMSEYELRVALSRENFNQEIKKNPSKKKNLVKQNAVYRGEKNLAGADLRGFDLQGIDLSGANLENANLESTDLRSANLKNANLKGANLENAYCKNAVFFRANLTNVKLQGTFLPQANMLEAEGLSVDALCTAATLYKTLLEGSVIEVLESNCPAKLKKPTGGWDQKVYTEQQQIPASEQADPRQFH